MTSSCPSDAMIVATNLNFPVQVAKDITSDCNRELYEGEDCDGDCKVNMLHRTISRHIVNLSVISDLFVV